MIADPGYCIGCGRRMPCTQKHTQLEMKRLDEADKRASMR